MLSPVWTEAAWDRNVNHRAIPEPDESEGLKGHSHLINQIE